MNASLTSHRARGRLAVAGGLGVALALTVLPVGAADAMPSAEPSAKPSVSAAGESADGATLTGTAGSITDAAGRVFTLVPSPLGGLGVALGGSYQDPTKNVDLAVYSGSAFYQRNSAGEWYRWNGTGWDAAAGDPRSAGAGSGGTGSAAPFLLGVNLASGGFDQASVPGVLGTNYSYPTHADIDYFAGKGMKVFRLSFLWERVQNTQFGPLGGRSGDLATLDDLVSYAASKGVKTLLDPHNFGSGFDNDIGTDATPTAAFTDFWGKFAGHYRNDGNVLFGVMNEPHDQSATQWVGISNAAIAAIRAAGATSQPVYVDGTYYDNAADWTNNDNASVIGEQTVDPADNVVFDVHCYYDANGGGSTPTAVSSTIGVERVAKVTDWARAHGKKLFLGEFGASTDATALAALDNQLTFLQQNRDVWVGGTYWAAGPGWGDYFGSAEPVDGADRPQTLVLVRHTGS